MENFLTKKPRWISGTIVKVTGPLSYEVELESRFCVRHHVDNVRRREENLREKQNSEQELSPPMLLGPQLSSETETAESIQPPENLDQPGTGEPGEQQAPEPDPNPPPCCSNCVRNPPVCYGH